MISLITEGYCSMTLGVLHIWHTAARADEVAMAAIRADPQILEEHLAIC